MLEYQLHTHKGILEIHPTAPLGSRDFVQLKEIIERYLSDHRHLQGLLIHSRDMPGWEDFAELISHVHFMQDNQQQIHKVAAIADRRLDGILKTINDHFYYADVRFFLDQSREDAESWLESTQQNSRTA